MKARIAEIMDAIDPIIPEVMHVEFNAFKLCTLQEDGELYDEIVDLLNSAEKDLKDAILSLRCAKIRLEEMEKIK